MKHYFNMELMMIKKALGIALLCGTGFAAQAVTVDMRHEYTDNGQNKDRVSVSHRFANGFGFSVEAKWKSGGDKQDQLFADFIGNGHEESISWLFRPFGRNFQVTPSFNIESNDSRSIYKPGLRLQYSFDSGIYLATRYRHDYTRYPSNAGKDDDKVNRVDVWAGYVINDWRVELNYLYKHSDHNIRQNNKKGEDEYNAKLAYKIDKNWAPYVEVGNVTGNKYTDERQTRYRVGVAYSF